MTPRHDARLVPVAIAAYIVAGTVAAGLVESRWWIVLGLAGVGIGAVRPWRRLGSVLVVGLTVACMAGATTIHLDSRLAGGVGEALSSQQVVTFWGRVASDPSPISAGPFDLNGKRWSITITLTGLALPGREAERAGATVSIVGGEEWANATVGTIVEAKGRLSPTSPGHVAGVSWNPELVSLTPATGVDGVVGRLRKGFRESASHLPEGIRALTVGMTIGDTSGMPDTQVQDMRIASLTHLTAVSGAQFAMLALAVGAGARALRWSRRLRVLLLLLVTVGFVVLVLPEPSVLRAAWMGGIVALALWWGRPGQALPALSAAVIGLLLVDPFLSLSYGFALSVAATASIVLWAPIVAMRLARVVPPLLAKALSLPIAAQVVCAPILVLLSAGVGPYAVVANLVALPVAALVTAFGLASVIVTPISPTAGIGLAWVAGVAAEPVAWAAHTAANLPGAWLPWPEGVTGAALAACVSAAIIVSTTTRRVTGWARISFLLLTLAVVAATPVVRATLDEATRKAPEDWAVAVCDVGQGDMILLRAGPSSAVVVDVGPDDGEPLACLSRHRVSHVPLLVITHPHADHDGGLDEVVARIDVAYVWMSEPGAAHSGDGRLLESAGVPYAIPVPGTEATIGDVHIIVWHAGDPEARTDSEVNESSLVVWGETRGVTFLSLGDLEGGGQRALASVLHLPQVDVLKVAHHGSARQDPDLASRVRATLAVISVGEGNPYGHPAPSTIDMEHDAGAVVMRTDECGDVDIARREDLTVTARCPLDVGG